MPLPTDEETLRRCWEFESALDADYVERVEDVGDGLTAMIDTRVPLVWDSNFLIAESPEVDAATVAAKADEVLGGLGMKHRAACTREPGWAPSLVDGLEKLGWEREDDVYMQLRGEPDRPPSVEVEQVDMSEVAQVSRAIILVEDWGTEEVADQLLERDRRIGDFCRDRWFAARHEGEIASCCRLMQRDGFGKVEDVSTLEPARNRGLARAVVLEAARTSVADGDELTYIVALADDWPRKLYRRLGFEALGEASSARRKP